MLSRTNPTLILILALMLALSATVATAGDAPGVEEQMNGLIAMCDASGDARAERQSAEPLYDRLGGYDRILTLTREIVRLHAVNPDFEVMVRHVDHEHLARQVADFMAAGTGGTQTYRGRSMPEAHSRLRLTDADFLSAGGDVIQAMKNLDYGQEEIDEVVCILVSLKDQVVLK